MTRTLTILAAIATLAVTAGPAAAYSSDSGDRPTESLSYTKAPPKPPRAVGTRAGAGQHYGFMDYTDDSCIAKTKGSRPQAASKRLGTRNGGEVISADAY